MTTGENPLWSAGRQATIIGWGDTGDGSDVSQVLLETTAPMRSDLDCGNAYGTAATASTRPRWCARATAAPTPARATPAAR